jgi:hypothetical protein
MGRQRTLTEPGTITLAQAHILTRIPLKTLYNAIARGELTAHKDGNTVVCVAELQRAQAEGLGSRERGRHRRRAIQQDWIRVTARRLEASREAMTKAAPERRVEA